MSRMKDSGRHGPATSSGAVATRETLSRGAAPLVEREAEEQVAHGQQQQQR